MEVLFQNQYATITYDRENNLFLDIWTSETADLSEDDFKDIISSWQQLVVEHQVKLALTDMADFQIPLTPELQDWLVEQVLHPTSKHAYSKHAFVIPTEFFAHLSLEQIIEDGNENAHNLQMKYFEDLEEGKGWLLAG